MTSTAETIARFLIYLASQGDEPSPVTHLQVQKLLYYAQGWCLVKYERGLFAERIEAWAHGPVVAELYPRFKKFENRAIGVEEGRDGADLPRADREHVELVWREYGRYSASGLRDMTHAEAPWKDARKGLPEDAPSKVPITEEAMRLFFKKEQENKLKRMGIDPAGLERSLEQARKGETIPWEVVKRETRAEIAGSDARSLANKAGAGASEPSSVPNRP